MGRNQRRRALRHGRALAPRRLTLPEIWECLYSADESYERIALAALRRRRLISGDEMAYVAMQPPHNNGVGQIDVYGPDPYRREPVYAPADEDGQPSGIRVGTCIMHSYRRTICARSLSLPR